MNYHGRTFNSIIVVDHGLYDVLYIRIITYLYIYIHVRIRICVYVKSSILSCVHTYVFRYEIVVKTYTNITANKNKYTFLVYDWIAM